MLEKRGRKAAQRALRELTNGGGVGARHGTGNHRSPAAADATGNTTADSIDRGGGGGGGKRRATHHPYDHGTNHAPRRTPLGGVSENHSSRATGGDGSGGGERLRLESATSRRAGLPVSREEEVDAVWLREAEALLSRSNQDL